MKKISFLLCLLAAFGLYSCVQDEAFVGGIPSKGLTAEIPSYEFEGNSTRVNISESLSTYTWENGDKIGIYYTSGTTSADAKFMLKQGGNSHGEFYNEAFSLKPNSTYYAFYPYDSNATVDSYPVDFTGQEQTANGSTEYIGTHNYMSAEVNTDTNGAAFIAFQNQASVIQLLLPIEDDGTYTGVTLSTANTDFITQGTLNMKTGSITAKAKSQQMKVSFGQGISMSEGETLTVNILVAPVDLTGKTFSVTLETGSKTYNFEELEGKDLQKGKAYKVDCVSGAIEEIPYLTFSAEAEQTFTMTKAVETLEYSVNGGDWQILGTNTVTFGGENGKLQLRGKSSKGTASSYTDYSSIYFGNVTKVACSGDIRTLVDYEAYKTTSTESARFCRLFENCSVLTSAPSLPATTLADVCYYRMFQGCSSLASAPALPATTLNQECYQAMFRDCSSLASAPALPATTLSVRCYYSMFFGCSSLTSAPSLPATTLADDCYQAMFRGCSRLTSAPALPATTLADYCYYYMFSGCSKLNYIKMLATDISANNCLHNWTSGVSSTGTFVKNAAATWDVTGASGIPEDWTVELADYTYQDGREYVDLGLPSGTLWATQNIGANGLYDAGTEFTTWPSADKASAAWGTSWTTPTKAQLEELNENVTWEQHYKYPSSWSEYMATRTPAINDNFYDGCYFTATSKINGNVLILPAKLFYSEDMMSEFLMTNLMGKDTEMLLGIHFLNDGSYAGPGFFTHEMENYDPDGEKEWHYDSYYFNHIRPVTKK